MINQCDICPCEGLCSLKIFLKVSEYFLLIHSLDIQSICFMPGGVLNSRNKMKNKIDTAPTYMVLRE